uniref:Uncharacterized protein n=1 Tax=Heterorhabditis bacteriophora TaxID=37862 RepID=A0A1I7WHA4_HETBA
MKEKHFELYISSVLEQMEKGPVSLNLVARIKAHPLYDTRPMVKELLESIIGLYLYYFFHCIVIINCRFLIFVLTSVVGILVKMYSMLLILLRKDLKFSEILLARYYVLYL